MAIVPLKDVCEIYTAQFWYDKVQNLEEVYLSGVLFLRFSHMTRGKESQREFVSIAASTITKFVYRDSISPELQTAKDVLEAYKEGRLVGN